MSELILGMESAKIFATTLFGKGKNMPVSPGFILDIIERVENSTPNAKILELVTNYEICMKWKPSPESIKFLDDLKKLIKPEGE